MIGQPGCAYVALDPAAQAVFVAPPVASKADRLARRMMAAESIGHGPSSSASVRSGPAEWV